MRVVVFILQPYMTINTCTFIKPAFILRRDLLYHYYIFFIIIDEIRDIVRKTYVSTFIIPDDKSINPNFASRKIPSN